ncbi:MAG TPA: MFS transporter [Vicinamibacterales bacterium]|nr:MFS transporter [Vicinamibacterales bacterium]
MIARLLARIGLVTPEQRAWAWYDWANSVYFTTVITAVFPSFFATYAAKGLEPAEATARFGLVTTVSVAVIAIISPLLGAFADYSGAKKKFLGLFLVIGISACAAMALIGEGDVNLAMTLFFIGNIGISGSLVFYDSLLPHVARPEETDRVSSAGYAMGYLSGGVLLLINLAWILQPAAFGFADTPSAIRASFIAVALWWAAFSIPLFRKVAEPPPDHSTRAGSPFTVAFVRLARTFKEIRRYRNAFLLFIAMLLYQDGIQTVIRMSSVYGAEVGIEQTSQIAAFVMVQFVGIPCAFLFGALGTRIGSKGAIFVAIGVYVVAAGLAYFMTTVTHFFILAFLIALVMGGSQALSRAMFARLIPQDRSSEFFGFYAVSERFATVFGPALFTISVLVTGSSRSAILAIIGLFLAGAFVLSLVDEKEGMRAARAT